jgi:hypothetical protein
VRGVGDELPLRGAGALEVAHQTLEARARGDRGTGRDRRERANEAERNAREEQLAEQVLDPRHGARGLHRAALAGGHREHGVAVRPGAHRLERRPGLAPRDAACALRDRKVDVPPRADGAAVGADRAPEVRHRLGVLAGTRQIARGRHDRDERRRRVAQLVLDLRVQTLRHERVHRRDDRDLDEEHRHRGEEGDPQADAHDARIT